MGLTVSLAGASGYAGGELLRLLAGHPDLEVGALAAGANAGQPVTSVHPSLLSLSDRRFVETEPGSLAEADLVFLALPHGQSAAVAERLPAATRVVDLGADFRLARASDWHTYYGGEHAGTWTYGLPELPGVRELVRASRRVANPGCYATSIVLGLAPLLAAGLIEPTDVVVVGASGTSGAGRQVSDRLLASTVMGAVTPYKVGGSHQHTPEIEQALSGAAGTPVTLSFTPLLVPMPRGILSTCTARVLAGVTTHDVRSALAAAYAGEPFVQVTADDVWPSTKATQGSNMALVQAAVDDHAGRAVVTVAIDNLGKGAAGQALQNANLMLGLPETAGLTGAAVWP